jgi:hypothetical protein
LSCFGGSSGLLPWLVMETAFGALIVRGVVAVSLREASFFETRAAGSLGGTSVWECWGILHFDRCLVGPIA